MRRIAYAIWTVSGVLLASDYSYGNSAPVEWRDLNLESVVLLPRSEVPAPDSGSVLGSRPDVMMTTFSSRLDLQAIASRSGYFPSNNTSLCQGASIDPKRPLLGLPLVYDQHGMIDNFRKPEVSSGDPSKRIAYHIYFDVRQEGTKNYVPHKHGTIVFYQYDLRHESSDVCFQLSGLNEDTGEQVSSNIVVIPRKLVDDALRSGSQAP
jgi:hypothetical protein